MGIARRKAGTTVTCTLCQSPVQVPYTDAPDNPAAPAVVMPSAPAASQSRDVFDRDDFDSLLQREKRSPIAPPPPVQVGGVFANQVAAGGPGWGSSTSAPETSLFSSGYQSTQSPDATNGVMLTPGRATLLTVVFIFLLAGAFVAGLLIGRFAM